MKAKTKEILIKTRRRLFGQNIGNNISAFQGNGIDFAELKEYSYGDDVRKINWNVTAREQKPYINVFNEERELNIVLGLCVSGSLYFGSVRQKQEVAAEILALLGLSAIKNSDRVTTIFFDELPVRRYKPTKSQNTIYAQVEDALSLEMLHKKSDLQAFADYLLQTVKQRSIVVLVGDFKNEADLSFLGAKHELYIAMVRDRFEEDPSIEGVWSLQDPESAQVHTIDLDERALERFRSEIRQLDAGWRSHFLKNRIGFTKIYTDEDPFIKLREMLK
ncbi:DUF58 domain-containing protein [Hydrogenimonas sp.]